MVTMGCVIPDYLTHLRAAGASAGTVRLRRNHLTNLSARLDNLDDATTADLEAFLARPGWAAETRKAARSSVRGYYRWLRESGARCDNPAENLPSVHVPPGIARPAPAEIVQSAMDAADARGRLMLALGYRAGLRRAEIARLRVADVQGRTLYVRGKGDRGRRVPLCASLVAELGGWVAGLQGWPWVFPGQDHGHLSPNRVGVLLARYLGAGYTGHQLRHAAASRWYRVDRDLLAVQELLGHSKPETTRRYVELPEDALRRCVDA